VSESIVHPAQDVAVCAVFRFGGAIINEQADSRGQLDLGPFARIGLERQFVELGSRLVLLVVLGQPYPQPFS
jgi:hypothetical protein